MARRLRSRHYGGNLALLVAAATAATALDASLSPIAGSLTAACWVKGTAQTTTTEVLELVNATSADGLSISISSGSLVAKVRGGTAASVAASVVLNGSWHRVTASCDASTKTIVLYVDGVQVATSGAAAWSGSFAATCKLVLGLGSIGNSALTTQDDAVLDIGHAWSAADVAADYYDATPPNTYTHRWPLDDGAGATARATRGGLALTLSGGAAFSADSPMIGRGCARNLLAQSGHVDTAPWANSATITTSAYGGTFPDGVGAAVTLTGTAAVSTHFVTQPVSGAPTSGSLIVSGYATKVSGNGWVLLFPGAGSFAYFNLNTGAVGNVSAGVTASCEDKGGGVYRVSMLIPAGALAGLFYAMLAQSNGVISYNATGDAVALSGCMVEPAYPGQTTPSPYVATGAAPLSVYGARETRQNLAQSSEDQSTALWISGSVSRLANQGAASVGQYTKITDDATTNRHYFVASPNSMFGGVMPVPVGAKATLVARIKAGTKGWAWLTTNQDACKAWVNLSTGAVGSTVACTVRPPIQTAPGEWLIAMTYTQALVGPSASFMSINIATADAQQSYAGDGLGTIYTAGVQLVGADCLPDYIKTTTAPANASGAPRSQAL